jgi:transposase
MRRNDDRDGEAIAEAATRPTMRFVALKSEAQLDMQTLHRGRDQFVGERLQGLDRRIAALDAEFAEQARTDENARRLTTVPGIGALNATALVAAIGDVATFARGRDLAA